MMLLIFLFSQSSIFVQSSSPPCELLFPESNVCFYTINSNHYSDAEILCNEQFAGILAHGDLLVNYTSSSDFTKYHMSWIGLRRVNGAWRWIDGNVIGNNNLKSLPWFDFEKVKMISTDSISFCVALFEKKWHMIKCSDRLNFALCQRPKRSKCHYWNHSKPCLWEDNDCVQKIYTFHHESDEDIGQTKCTIVSGNYEKVQCTKDKCINCQLTKWSQWSACHPYCDMNSIRTRFRFINVQAHDYICNENFYKLKENEKCESECEVDSGSNNTNVSTTSSTDDDMYYDVEDEEEEKEYSNAIFNWIIIVIIVIFVGGGLILTLIIYQKIQYKYKLHERTKYPSKNITGSMSAEGECHHGKKTTTCSCKSFEESVSQSLDKLGFWCH